MVQQNKKKEEPADEDIMDFFNNGPEPDEYQVAAHGGFSMSDFKSEGPSVPRGDIKFVDYSKTPKAKTDK